ncbi:hypothetical protein MAR_016633 [Mya arenaria]|uniref:Uncharacterized protein n=1 Tax=Mya arenaria TaxID=6604 RepID=A0ABY7FNE3_MYAAR|nr:hypothetical protein MAR_016633 [Mya arenaria]
MDECGSHFHVPCGHREICNNFIGSYRFMRVFAALADKGTTCNLHVRANKNRNVEPVHCFHSQNNIYCKEPAHCFNAYHCINYKEPAHCFNGYGVAAEEDPCKGKPCSLTGECAISRLGKCTCKKVHTRVFASLAGMEPTVHLTTVPSVLVKMVVHVLMATVFVRVIGRATIARLMFQQT